MQRRFCDLCDAPLGPHIQKMWFLDVGNDRVLETELKLRDHTHEVCGQCMLVALHKAIEKLEAKLQR